MAGLSGAELLGWAGILEAEAARLRERLEREAEDARRLAEEAAGEAPEALQERLAAARREAEELLRQIGAAAGVLHRTGPLQLKLEDLQEGLRRVADDSPPLLLLGSLLHGMGRELDRRCAAELRSLCGVLPEPPEDYLEESADVPITEIHRRVLAEHPELRAFAAENPDALLVSAGEGQVAAVVGDADGAGSIATVVAGVGSSEPSHWSGTVARARTVAAATGGAAVAWLGYPAPGPNAEAIGARRARLGAGNLLAFQEALAARRPGQRRIVIGHSYGSTVVGHAAADPRRPLPADHVVLLGSPGVPQRHAGELHLAGEGEVHAMTYLGDGIGHLTGSGAGVHGADPSSRAFGAEGIRGGREDRGHSDYWEDPALLAALRRMATR